MEAGSPRPAQRGRGPPIRCKVVGQGRVEGDDPSSAAGALVTASIQSGFLPQVRLLNPTSANLLSLRNLPAGLVINRGDYVSFQSATAPVRFAFHQIIEETTTVDASGLTANMEVRPHLQPGWQVGDIAQITFPRCKAKILPGTVQRGRSTKFMTEGVSFQFQQTLR